MIKAVQFLIILSLSLLIVGQEYDSVENYEALQVDQANVSIDDNSKDVDLDNAITSIIQLFSPQVTSFVITQCQQELVKFSFAVFSIRAPPTLSYS